MDKDLTYDEWTQKVKIGILTEAGNCPVTSLILMLQGKWKFQIIYEMCIKSPIRFGELEKDGLVSRIQFNEIPPHVEYSLTDKGTALLPVFYAMTKWGLTYIP